MRFIHFEDKNILVSLIIQRSFLSCTSNNKTATISAPFAFVFCSDLYHSFFSPSILMKLPLFGEKNPNSTLPFKIPKFSRWFSIFVLSLTLSLLVIKVALKHFPKPNTLILGSFPTSEKQWSAVIKCVLWSWKHLAWVLAATLPGACIWGIHWPSLGVRCYHLGNFMRYFGFNYAWPLCFLSVSENNAGTQSNMSLFLSQQTMFLVEKIFSLHFSNISKIYTFLSISIFIICVGFLFPLVWTILIDSESVFLTLVSFSPLLCPH